MTAARISKTNSKKSSAKTVATAPKRNKAGVKNSKSGARKPASPKSAAKTSPQKSKPTVKKPAAKKPAVKKSTAKTAPKKTVARKSTPKPTAQKTTARKSAARKPADKKPTAKTAPRTTARKKAASVKPTAKTKRPSGHKTPLTKAPFDAYKGTKSYIFVSYAHKNMRDVFNIIKKLNQSRYRIWYDEGIEPGFEWPEVVGKAIIGASQLLVFMSRVAAQSRNVRNEINLAFAENKDILVVYLENAGLSEGMKLQIGTVQHINRFEMTEPEFINKLKTVLSSKFRI